jgi:hypothetical protein
MNLPPIEPLQIGLRDRLRAQEQTLLPHPSLSHQMGEGWGEGSHTPHSALRTPHSQ